GGGAGRESGGSPARGSGARRPLRKDTALHGRLLTGGAARGATAPRATPRSPPPRSRSPTRARPRGTGSRRRRRQRARPRGRGRARRAPGAATARPRAQATPLLVAYAIPGGAGGD